MKIADFDRPLTENTEDIVNALGNLKFGQETTVNIGEPGLGEARGQDKGANGRIAEYVCASVLAELLAKNGLRVSTDRNALKEMANNEIKKYSQSLTLDQINAAIKAGDAMAESMAASIFNNGKDLVFTDYEFLPSDHTYDIEPTGAAQNKGSTDDLVIHITKDGPNEVAKKILLSLKVSASSENSQGSKGPLPLLWKLFVDPAAKTVKAADFIRVFGPKGKEFVDALEDFKTVGRSYLDTPQGQAWAKEKEQERIARGKDPKKAKVSASGNYFRSKEVGDYYTQTRGTPSEHTLSRLFVELYNQGVKNLNAGDWKKFNEGFKQAIGFDSVITYKAICDKQGVTSVVSSATSPGYQAMYKALENQINVVLTHRPNSGGIGVSLTYGNTVLSSLSCSIWKDGTIQFKFDSSAE